MLIPKRKGAALPNLLTTSSQSLSSSSLLQRPILMTQRPPYLFNSSSHMGLASEEVGDRQRESGKEKETERL